MEYPNRFRSIALGISAVLPACDDGDPAEFTDADWEYRNGGGGRESPSPGDGRDSGGAGGDWIRNGLGAYHAITVHVQGC